MTTRFMRRYGIVIVALLALALLGSAVRGAWTPARAHGAGSGSPSRIAVIGDSVAYGAHDSVRGGWVTRLQRLLDAAYPAARLRVANRASNGGTTGDLVRILRRRPAVLDAKLAIIAYGLNDFDERVPAASMAAHLRAALRLLSRRPHPPTVILMGMPPIVGLSSARLHAERAFTDAIRRVALETHSGYVDQFDLWLALGPALMRRLHYDTEHPNRFGYAFTAAGVAAFLEGAYLDSHGQIRRPRVPPTCASAFCGS